MPEQVPFRALIRLAVLFVAVSFVFVSINVFTQHAPTAHGLRVAYVGSPIAQVFIQTGLDKTAPGAFELRRYPNAASARAAVLERAVYGAFIERKKTALLLSASAAGPGAQQAIEHGFTEMTIHAPPSMRVKLLSEDLRPLPANDSRGLSSSAYQFALLVSGFVFAILLFIFGRGAALAQRLLAAGIYVLASSLVGALTVGPLIGALAGHFWAILAIGALFSLAIVLTTYGLEFFLGLAGTGVAAFVLVLIGNSTSGGGSNQEFLPNVFRQIGQALPNGAFVRFVRNTVYFNGNHTFVAVLVMAAWALAGLALVFAGSALSARRAGEKKALAVS
ncbi:MAG: hypothetical protein ABSC51_10575 [Gaiellaceae bacterium]|jgi:hypothetical protein